MSATKTIVITGASSGIGLACATHLARQGHSLILISLASSCLKQVAENLLKENSQAKIYYYFADLSLSLERIKVAQEIKMHFDKIDILLNNAGGVFSKFTTTIEGIEQAIALNHLGYFQLTILLLDVLKNSENAHVLNVTSEAHFDGKINFDSFRHEVPYSLHDYWSDWINARFSLKILYLAMGFYLMQSYAQSKLANVLFTLYAAKQFQSANIRVNCIHPGFVKSSITRSRFVPFYSRYFWEFAMAVQGKNAPDAAQEIVKFMLDENKNFNGKYIQDSKWTAPSIAAQNKMLQEKLWHVSKQLCNIDYETI